MASTPTIRSFLDKMLSGGRDLAQRGEDMAADRLGVDDDVGARSQMRNTALASGAAAGVMGLLLGSRGGRRMAGRVAVMGGLGYLGKVAFDAWQNSKSGDSSPQAAPIDQLTDASSETRARTLAAAMISAAKADGHIDDTERAAIEAQLAEWSPDLRAALTSDLMRAADPAAIAAMAQSDQERREIYAASLVLCGKDHPAEAAYLTNLAAALALPADVVAEIDREMARA